MEDIETVHSERLKERTPKADVANEKQVRLIRQAAAPEVIALSKLEKPASTTLWLDGV